MVKTGVVYLQCKNCVIHTERFTGQILTMGRYTNLRTFTFTLRIVLLYIIILR